MTTWAEFLAKLRRGLKDTNEGKYTWDTPELLDYANDALVTLAEHTAQEKSWLYTIVGDETTVALPADVLQLKEVWAVGPVSERLLTPRYRQPGETYYELAGAEVPAVYYEWPEGGQINFFRPLGTGLVNQLRVNYWAYWGQLTGAEDQALGLPRWMEEPMDWLIRAHAMAKPGIDAAKIRPYMTRQDGGQPEDNPALAYARYCQRQYDLKMANHPQQVRTGAESN